MITTHQTTLSKDLANKKLIIIREFDAPLEQVWKAWTEKDLLDMWWAPKPWKAKTKSMDFSEGGQWFYSMVGPDGTDSWCCVDFKKIVANKSFISEDSFCDENGNDNPELPHMHWNNEFIETNSGTQVKVELTFENEADLQKILEMGFEEGFTSAHGNLDELLAK